MAAWKHHPHEQHGKNETHGVAVEFERARINFARSFILAVFQHLAGIDHADQQTRQKHKTLSVFDKRQLAMVDLDQPIPTDEDEVVDQHENEEVASHSINDIETFHGRITLVER